jgi:hypothetical protein
VVTVALVSISQCITGYVLNLNLVINKAAFPLECECKPSHSPFRVPV